MPSKPVKFSWFHDGEEKPPFELPMTKTNSLNLLTCNMKTYVSDFTNLRQKVDEKEFALLTDSVVNNAVSDRKDGNERIVLLTDSSGASANSQNGHCLDDLINLRPTGSTCQNCGLKNPQKLLKCLDKSCGDYCICGECESKGTHNQHPMLRFVAVDMKPETRPNQFQENKAALIQQSEPEICMTPVKNNGHYQDTLGTASPGNNPLMKPSSGTDTPSQDGYRERMGVMRCPIPECDGRLTYIDRKGYQFLGCTNFRDFGCKGSANVKSGAIKIQRFTTECRHPCEKCGLKKVTIIFERGHKPSYLPLTANGCLTCDSKMARYIHEM